MCKQDIQLRMEHGPGSGLCVTICERGGGWWYVGLVGGDGPKGGGL